MTSVTKIEQIYKSGNEELAIQLLNSLSDYSCIKYLLIHFNDKDSVRRILNHYDTLLQCVSRLFAYRNIKTNLSNY